MPEMTMYFGLRWFDTIRIACHHSDCRIITELPVVKVEELKKKTGSCCPACGKPFTKPSVNGGADTVTQVAKAIIALEELAPQVGLYFPVKSESKN